VEMEESWTQSLLTSSRRALGDFSARAELAVGGLESRLNHPNGGVRRAAVETLGRLASGNLLNHVPKIVSLLEDDDDAVRTAAVDTLGKLDEGEGDTGQPSANGSRGLTTLDKLLPALSLLNRMDAKELAQHKLQPDAFSDEILNAIKLLADPTNHAVRQPAMQIISRLAPSALAHHAELLHWLMSDEAPQVRKAAVESIGRLPPSSALRYAEAMRARLEDVDNHVRLATLKMVGKLHGDRSMSHDMTSSVVARLADPDRYVRAAVRQQLGRLDAGALREVVPEIVPLLAHEAAEVRLVALEVMDALEAQTIAHPYVARAIAKCARLDDSAYVRSQATTTLGRKAVGEAIESYRSRPHGTFTTSRGAVGEGAGVGGDSTGSPPSSRRGGGVALRGMSKPPPTILESSIESADTIK